MRQLQKYMSRVPSDLRETVDRLIHVSNGRDLEAIQRRDYEVRCANGDRISVRERTKIRIYEVEE